MAASCARRAHFTLGKLTQCFEHCPQLWAHQSPHFPDMLEEPRFDPWAALGGEPDLFVRRFVAAGGDAKCGGMGGKRR